jgi:hypothetical protein
MSEQINSGQVEEQQEQQSGLLLSVEPLQQQGGMKLSAGDDNADTGGSGVKDTGDDAGSDDAGGGDSSDADGSDTKGADTDLTDTLGADTDGSDGSSDTDGSDGSGSDGADHSDDASIKIDSKDS